MPGLLLKLAAGERLIINGTLLEIGDKPARVRILDPKCGVLRCRDALKPEDVDTPVKQIYYAIQLLITGDLDEAETLPAIDVACGKLLDVFATLDVDVVPTLRSMIDLGNYYSAMCLLRQIIAIEAKLLARSESETAPQLPARVA